jgi:hypothetical protein
VRLEESFHQLPSADTVNLHDPPLPHTRLSPPADMRGSPEQGAEYHILMSAPTPGWLQSGQVQFYLRMNMYTTDFILVRKMNQIYMFNKQHSLTTKISEKETTPVTLCNTLFHRVG